MMHVGFNANDKEIRELLTNNIYVIPRNQRRYVWDKSNWEELFNDLILVVDDVSTGHFIGSIVLKEDSEDNGLKHFNVIDGQQRVMTFTIIISAIMYAFHARDLAEDFKGLSKYVITNNLSGIEMNILQSDYNRNIEQIVTSITKLNEKYTSFTHFLKQQSILYKKDSVVDAYNYFISAFEDMTDKKLKEFRDAVLKTTYVDIQASNEEDSYTIFEILNARGLELDSYELLKNYIMRYVVPIQRRDAAKVKWQEFEQKFSVSELRYFISHYTVHKFNSSSRLSDYKIIQQNTDPRNVSALLEDIILKASYYESMIHPNIDNCVTDVDKLEFKVFDFLKKKRHKQWRPVFLSLKRLHEVSKISDTKYCDVLNYLYRFFICFKIIGQENSNRLDQTISKYAYELENHYSDTSVDDFMKSMKKKLPSRNAFIESFVTIGYSIHNEYYDDSNYKTKVKLIFEIIEQLQSGSRNFDAEEYTVEHIYPDSAGGDNHNIGNLILLEQTINQACENKNLIDKIELYSKSSLRIVRNFSERYKSSEFKIGSRAKHLAALLYDNILTVNE